MLSKYIGTLSPQFIPPIEKLLTERPTELSFRLYIEIIDQCQISGFTVLKDLVYESVMSNLSKAADYNYKEQLLADGVVPDDILIIFILKHSDKFCELANYTQTLNKVI